MNSVASLNAIEVSIASGTSPVGNNICPWRSPNSPIARACVISKRASVVLHQRSIHSGIRSRISRSTLADANERRSWKIYQDLVLVLIDWARAQSRDDRLLSEIESAVDALDATRIELCLALFP
jgi:hypothetical protein